MNHARRFCLAALALACLAGALPALGSQTLVRVSFRNDTGSTLKYLFASASDSRVWGPDLLGERSMKYGQVEHFYVHFAGASTCFDFLAIDTRGDAYLLQAYRLSEEKDSIIRLGQDLCIGPHTPMRLCRIYVTNDSNRTFNYLFIAPEESQHWGFELLTDASHLAPGESLSLAVPSGPRMRRFEVLALSRDQALVQRQIGIDAAKPEIYLNFTLGDLH